VERVRRMRTMGLLHKRTNLGGSGRVRVSEEPRSEDAI
jgi:hypothetical protein